MDFYLNNDNVVTRMVKEWEEHNILVIAYDFDNTVYDYHKEGHSYDDVITLLRKCREVGAYFIVFTACDEELFPTIVSFLKENDIPFDSINDNAPFIKFSGRKIYYNVLLDDRAGLKSAFDSLSEALSVIKRRSGN